MPTRFPRPAEPTLSVARTPVPGTCEDCGSAALRGYPVLTEDGWFDVVKCQDCLHTVSREPGPPLGGVELLVDSL
ncbi:hypothetical protein [Amycolatopsis sp. Poz14]|uniref:hypothetical protein n=1 Tax=Amycolatopsis sp. Poz14 TaxID=1447705 RepID=UPI001EE8625D|nr:hypothetical protein [Amycolatopsis sp. Poz14]MCG3754028.1 hypothetical protein [Amycolatopsis sp. Poz14]